MHQLPRLPSHPLPAGTTTAAHAAASGGRAPAKRGGRPREKKSYDALIDPGLPIEEVRRLRRMLSNRESARRSRRRRQTQLSGLEEELEQLKSGGCCARWLTPWLPGGGSLWLRAVQAQSSLWPCRRCWSCACAPHPQGVQTGSSLPRLPHPDCGPPLPTHSPTHTPTHRHTTTTTTRRAATHPHPPTPTPATPALAADKERLQSELHHTTSFAQQLSAEKQQLLAEVERLRCQLAAASTSSPTAAAAQQQQAQAGSMSAELPPGSSGLPPLIEKAQRLARQLVSTSRAGGPTGWPVVCTMAVGVALAATLCQ